VHTKFWQDDLKERDHLGNLGGYGRIISKWLYITECEDVDCGLDSSGPRQGPLAASCGHGNEPSGSIECEEFTDKWSD